MTKILITDGMDKNAQNFLINNGYLIEEKFYKKDELLEKVKDIDILVVRSATKVDRDVIDAAAAGGNLKLIIRAGVGLDNIDVKYAEENGITVRNTPFASSNAVAELVLANMITLSRNVKSANIKLRNGLWDKKNLKGMEIAGKTLGIIGFGRIARNLACKANALGMNVIYTDIIPCDCENDAFRLVDRDFLIENADFVTVHTPLTEDTRYLFNKDAFRKMKNTAFFINCARGGIVAEKDLVDAINTREIAGAALDCFEDEPNPALELLDNPNIIVTPHIGASTFEAQDRIGQEIIDIIING